MSPTIFRESGYRFFFFSREESRMYVHVYRGEGEAKFWLEPHIELANNFRCTMMNSRALGTNTSQVEVTHISSHGVWLLARGHELFMSYENFPWFRDVPVGKILNVEEPTPGHYYWPDMDIDLTDEILAHPGRFPLQAP